MNRPLTRFVRVGCHLVNFEAIARVELLAGDAANLFLQGARKGLQCVPVPAPAGRELWNFVCENLAVVEFGSTEQAPAPKKAAKKSKRKHSKAQAAQA